MTIGDNLNDFLNVNDFAVTGSWTPTGGTATSVVGILLNPTAVSSPQSGEVLLSDVEFLCKTSVVTSAVEAEPIVIGGVTYYILTNEPDGTGMTRLRLGKEVPHGRQ
jgi:hypothetical protein